MCQSKKYDEVSHHPALSPQDMNHPFVQCVLPFTDLVAILVIRSTSMWLSGDPCFISQWLPKAKGVMLAFDVPKRNRKGFPLSKKVKVFNFLRKEKKIVCLDC